MRLAQQRSSAVGCPPLSPRATWACTSSAAHTHHPQRLPSSHQSDCDAYTTNVPSWTACQTSRGHAFVLQLNLLHLCVQLGKCQLRRPRRPRRTTSRLNTYITSVTSSLASCAATRHGLDRSVISTVLNTTYAHRPQTRFLSPLSSHSRVSPQLSTRPLLSHPPTRPR